MLVPLRRVDDVDGAFATLEAFRHEWRQPRIQIIGAFEQGADVAALNLEVAQLEA